MKPEPKSYLNHIDVYVGGKSRSTDGKPVIKLSSNENPYGPSPKAMEAYQSGASKLSRYPQDGAADLRETIQHVFGFDAAQIVCGTGSDDVIRMLCHAYAGSGDEVLYSKHGFAMYRIYANQFGAEAIAAPETKLRSDVESLLSHATERTKLLFLANPNNPTGSYLTKEEIHLLRHRLREDVILVLDGAYAEYVTADDYSDGSELVNSTNTVITRTFSKAYGLASLRIGWGYGPTHIIDNLYKVRSPFNVTQAALDAAIAALHDQDYLTHHIMRNHRERDTLTAELQALGLSVYPSAGNFILVDFAMAKDTAQNANRFLLQRNIIVRDVRNYHLPSCLRVSIGTEDENAAFLGAMKDWIA